MSFGDGVQPIHDRGLHCDPMIRKRMVGAHVLLDNLGIASLPQSFYYTNASLSAVLRSSASRTSMGRSFRRGTQFM
jgi:hypothetical protein